MPNLLLVDDHAMFADALQALLQARLPSLKWRRAGTATEALALLRGGVTCEVLVVDERLPDMPGHLLLNQAAQCRPEVARVLLSGLDDAGLPALAKQAGASAFVHKSGSADHLCKAIDAVLAGRVWFDSAPASEASAAPALTPRALQTLKLLAHGLSNREIAEEMGIGERAVKHHLRTLFDVLDVRNRTQAVLVARARRWL